MNIEQIKTIHDQLAATNPRDIPDQVLYIHASAGSNAGETCTENGIEYCSNGGYTDSYFSSWYGSVQDLLTSPEFADAETVAWFEKRGITA